MEARNEEAEAAPNQIDVWCISLAAEDDEVEHWLGLLSKDEVERADRFYFEQHRRRFIIGRGAMRQILSSYAGARPEKLVFTYSTEGKPELASAFGQCGIAFNMSHSADLALLAVARGQAVGVDVEWVNPDFAIQELAERFFSKNEASMLQQVAEEERARAFFSCWTRKEAYLKALGCGLQLPLDRFEVAFGPGVPPKLLSIADEPAEVTRWSMYDVAAPEEYAAALVAEGGAHTLRHLQWERRD